MRLRYKVMVLFIQVTVKMRSEAEWGEEHNEIKVAREREPVNKGGETKGNLLDWKAAGRGSPAGAVGRAGSSPQPSLHFTGPICKLRAVLSRSDTLWSLGLRLCGCVTGRMELKGMPRILISPFPSDMSWDINAAAPQALIPCPSPLALTVKPQPRSDHWAVISTVSCTGWGIRARNGPPVVSFPQPMPQPGSLKDEVETEVSTDWHGICNMNEDRLCCGCYIYVRHTSLYSASLYCGFYEGKVVATLHWAICPTSFV